jgi:hypothetical protein
MGVVRYFNFLVLVMFGGMGVGCAGGGATWSETAREGLSDRAERVGRIRLAQRALTSQESAGAFSKRDDQAAGRSMGFETPTAGEGGMVLASWMVNQDDATSEDLNTPSNDQSKSDADKMADEWGRGPLPGFWDTVRRDLELMPRSVWEDTKAVYTNPTNLVVLLSAGAASLAVRPEVDDDFEDSLRDKDIFKDDWSDAFGALGNPGMHFAAAGLWYLVGQQAQDVKTYEVGRTLFNALAINGASTMLLKLATLTHVPNGEPLGWPSGHTSSSVAFAVVMNEAYGPLAGIPLFGLAGLVAVERMDDEEHHFSDIVFGAALGYVVGYTVAKKHRPQIFGGDIVPYADPVSGSSGIAWVKCF